MHINKGYYAKKLRNILLMIFLSVNIIGFCQSSQLNEIKVNNTTFLNFLEDRIIKSYHSELNDIGEWGVRWVKIEVSEENKILNVSISPGTNKIFASLLKEEIEHTNDKWTFPQEFNGKENKILVVPICITFRRMERQKK